MDLVWNRGYSHDLWLSGLITTCRLYQTTLPISIKKYDFLLFSYENVLVKIILSTNRLCWNSIRNPGMMGKFHGFLISIECSTQIRSGTQNKVVWFVFIPDTRNQPQKCRRADQEHQRGPISECVTGYVPGNLPGKNEARLAVDQVAPIGRSANS